MMTFRRARLNGLVVIGFGVAMMAGCARTVPPTTTVSTDDVLHGIFRSSVQVLVERDGTPFRWGSGVVIGTHGLMTETECLVLTAGHTLAQLVSGDEVFALLDRHQAESVKAHAQVVMAEDNPKWDLALLKIRGQNCSVVRAGQPPSLGDAVWVVGFPHGGEMTVGRGIVSQASPSRTGARTGFTIDASTTHGSSGAGVFEARTGRLIGLVEAFGTARVMIRGEAGARHIDIPMPGMTYVTPVNRIDDFLRAAGGARPLVGRQ